MKHCVGCNYAFVMKLCSVGGGQCIDGQLICVPTRLLSVSIVSLCNMKRT